MVRNRKELIQVLTCDELEFEKTKVDCHNKNQCDPETLDTIEDLKFEKGCNF